MQPKTVKSFLKMCLDIAHADRDSLKGFDKLTKDEYLKLGDLRAGVQNDLGDMDDLLQKHNLKYDAGGNNS